MRVLELYSGIGGVAEALGDRAEIVLAVDQSPLAARVYRYNYPHPVAEKMVESMSAEDLGLFEAELWWASPPCQPFTRKGKQRFLDDKRADTFRDLLGKLEQIRPRYFAMENVPGFEISPGRALLLRVLERSGYRSIQEVRLCPTQFGYPNRRRRYFLLASHDTLPGAVPPVVERLPLSSFLDVDPDRSYRIDTTLLTRFRNAMDIVDPIDANAITACFGSGYARAIVRSGSYLRCEDGGVRRFTPAEVLRLLGYSGRFRYPEDVTDQQAWRLAGNSLSIPCVRHVVGCVPGLLAA